MLGRWEIRYDPEMSWTALAIVVIATLTGCIEAGLSRCASGRVCAEGYRCNDMLDRCVAMFATSCGDSLATDGEECDDGNLLSHDGCSSGCRIEHPVWRQVAANGIGARDRHAMAYDARRGRVVLFGGMNASSQILADTLEWDGVTWRTLTPVTSPPARHSAAMAYDPQTHTVLLFGGRSSQGVLEDTWQWDGTTWTRLAMTSGIGPHHLHAMALDTRQQRVVTFGGAYDTTATEGSELISVWTGTDWSGMSPPGPPGLILAAMSSYDQGTFMFGGYSFNVLVGETWRWDGMQWVDVPTQGPSKRAEHAMTYEGMGRVLLFGGRVQGGDSTADTWLWNRSNWSLISISTASPPPRNKHTFVYDAVRRTSVLVAGLYYARKYDDVWTFRFESDELDESCVAGADVDGDGKSGCDDPDCWGVCTPHCPPTSPALPCDMSLPRCGDGTCNADLEVAACPEDCK